MFKFLDSGLRLPNLAWRDLVWLFSRPTPPEDTGARKCYDRTCGRRAYRDHSYCEAHEIQQRLDMYDPETGWSK